MSVEEKLKSFILQKYKTITNFSKKTGIPNSTLSSIFNRGVLNANVFNMIVVCDALDIDIDCLADGKIEVKKVNATITAKEQKILTAYKQHEEFQLAIDTLLGIVETQHSTKEEPQLFVAASDGNPIKEIDKGVIDRLENAPEIDLDNL